MPPIWLCLDCEGVAYGWARGGPCIYCARPHVVGTDEVYFPDEPPADYRLVFIPIRQWAELEAEAASVGKSLRQIVEEREQAPVVRICEEPVQKGKLVLLVRKREQVET